MICLECKALNADNKEYCVECNSRLPKISAHSNSFNKQKNILAELPNKLEYTVTFSEVIKSLPASFIFNNVYRYAAIVYPFFFIGTLFFDGFYLLPFTIWIPLSIVSYIFFFGLHVTIFLLQFIIKRREILAPYKMGFNNDFFREENSFNQHEYKWREIKRLKLTKAYIFIIISWRRYHIIPKRVFNEKISWQYFVEFAQQRINAK